MHSYCFILPSCCSVVHCILLLVPHTLTTLNFPLHTPLIKKDTRRYQLLYRQFIAVYCFTPTGMFISVFGGLVQTFHRYIIVTNQDLNTKRILEYSQLDAIQSRSDQSLLTYTTIAVHLQNALYIEFLCIRYKTRIMHIL